MDILIVCLFLILYDLDERHSLYTVRVTFCRSCPGCWWNAQLQMDPVWESPGRGYLRRSKLIIFCLISSLPEISKHQVFFRLLEGQASH